MKDSVPKVGIEPTTHGFSVHSPTSREAEERWLPAPRYPNYEVSDLGRVRRSAPARGGLSRRGRIMRARLVGWPTRSYPYVALFRFDGAKKTVAVHVLVARAFLGEPPNGHEVDHIDRDKTNPRLSNLQYLTKRANLARRACRSCGAEGHFAKTCGESRDRDTRRRLRKRAAKRAQAVSS